MKEQTLSRGLAVFSLTLGFAELLAPRSVARLVGLQDEEEYETLIRLLGAREIASGLGLMQGRPEIFLWSRVAGDAIDLSLLGAAMQSDRHDRRRLTIAAAAVAGVTALDVFAATQASRSPAEPGWRVKDPQDYHAGFESGDPLALRASVDATLADAPPDSTDETAVTVANAAT